MLDKQSKIYVARHNEIVGFALNKCRETQYKESL